MRISNDLANKIMRSVVARQLARGDMTTTKQIRDWVTSQFPVSNNQIALFTKVLGRCAELAKYLELVKKPNETMKMAIEQLSYPIGENQMWIDCMRQEATHLFITTGKTVSLTLHGRQSGYTWIGRHGYRWFLNKSYTINDLETWLKKEYAELCYDDIAAIARSLHQTL